MATQDEISAKREELDRRGQKIRYDYDQQRLALQYEYKALQLECAHPNQFQRSIMGRDEVTTCPDCGWEQ